MLGVGAMLTKKKLKCQTCGEYNDTGSAKPYDGPKSREWRKQWEKSEGSKAASQRADEARQAQLHAQAIAAAMVDAAQGLQQSRSQQPDLTGTGVLGEPTAPPPSLDGPPPGWMKDPTDRHEHRYWDGQQWTPHVADAGVQALDPL